MKFLVVAVAILVGIAWTWIDYALHPLSGQVLGTLAGAPADRAHIELLDYRDRNVGVVDIVSGSDRFVATYEPFFGDPPVAIRVQAEDCEENRQGLTRHHLQFGTPVSLFMSCTSG